MRVVRITPLLKFGGVETGILHELEVAKNKSILDYYLISIEKPEKSMASTFERVSSKSNNISLNMKWWMVFDLKRVGNAFLFKSGDVIVSSLWKSHILSLLIYITRPNIEIVPFFHSSRSAHFLDRFVTKVILKYCNSAFVDSFSTEQYIRNNLGGRSVTLYKIPFVFETNSFSVPRKPKNSQVRFIFIGRINKVKNLISAISFFYVYNKINPRSIFDIYGPDEGDLSKCVDVINELNLNEVVSYKGVADRNDVSSILSGADFFLQTSLREGMAASVVEAMQHGVIPVVTPVGDIPSYSKSHISAFHFKSLDDNEFTRIAEDINKCIRNNTYIEMSEKAILSVRDLGDYTSSFFSALNDISAGNRLSK